MFRLSSLARSLGFSLFSFLLPFLVISFLLAGCSSEDIKIEFTGQIDRTLSAGTKACLDISGNGKCDPDEPFALTNPDGTYTITIPVESLDKFPLIVESVGNKTKKNITLSAPAGRHQFVSPVSTAVQSRVYQGSSLAAAEEDVRARYALPGHINLYTDYQGSPVGSESVQALTEAVDEVAADYGIDVAVSDEIAEVSEVAADRQRIGVRRVSGVSSTVSADSAAEEKTGDTTTSGSAISASVAVINADSSDTGGLQSQEAEASVVLAAAENEVSADAAVTSAAAVEAVVSEAASCTAKIVYIEDDQPNIAEAGKPISFTWKVQNKSSCNAEGYHLGFESSSPGSSTANFGGMNHPSFTLAPWETGFVQVNIPVAPKEVGTAFAVYFDIFKSDGTMLSRLEKGPLWAEFTVTAPPAQPTTLISPSNNATIDSETPTLKWESVSGATVYRVVLSENSSFSGLSNDGRSCSNNTCQTDTTNSTSYQVGSDLTVEFGNTYYWKVRDDASGQWSDYFKL